MAKGSTSPDCQSTSRRKTSAQRLPLNICRNRSRLEDVGSISWVTPIYSHIISYPYHCRFPSGPNAWVPDPENDCAISIISPRPWPVIMMMLWICVKSIHTFQTYHWMHSMFGPNHTSHGMVLIPVVCKKTTVRRSQWSQQPRYKMSVSTIRMTVPGVSLPMQPEMFFSWRLLTSSSWPNRDFIKPPSCQENSK